MTSDSFSTPWFEGSEVELLELYLAGKLTGSAAERVERWMAAHADARGVVEAFRSGVVDVDVRAPKAWEVMERVRARRGWREEALVPRGVGHGTARLGTQPLRGGVWRTFVGLTLGTAAIVTVWALHGDLHRRSSASAPLEYVTENGERAHITLPDGNMVALDVASRLDVPADYLTGDHALRLRGEAFFTIQHHVGVPVTVLTGQTTTRVLGTTFMVRHYATDTVTTVAVQTGKVAVGTTAVTANHLVEVHRNGAVDLRLASSSQFSFATGTLTLPDLYLPEAIPELDRWYDADIRLGNPALAALGVGGKFAAGSLADLSEILESTLDVRVVRDGRVLTLYPRR